MWEFIFEAVSYFPIISYLYSSLIDVKYRLLGIDNIEARILSYERSSCILITHSMVDQDCGLISCIMSSLLRITLTPLVELKLNQWPALSSARNEPFFHIYIATETRGLSEALCKRLCEYRGDMNWQNQ